MLSLFSRHPTLSTESYRPAAFENGASPASADDANWWMITLSDLTLLLLGFLVVWYATEKRVRPLQQPPAKVAARHAQPLPGARSIGESDKPHDWSRFKSEMQSLVAGAGLSEKVSVEATERDFLVSLSDTVPFASGKTEISAQALPVLDKLVSFTLARPQLLLEITGHTDSVPIATAVFPSNWELSAARASRVARYLIENGIDPSRIAVRGYADQRPKLPDADPATRRANRRVELRLYANTNIAAPVDSDEPAP